MCIRRGNQMQYSESVKVFLPIVDKHAPVKLTELLEPPGSMRNGKLYCSEIGGKPVRLLSWLVDKLSIENFCD
jgi:hypothetical protein